MKRFVWKYCGNLSFLLFGAFLIAGCSVGPDYRRPVEALAPAWLEAERSEFDTQPASLVNWWTEFNDAGAEFVG